MGKLLTVEDIAGRTQLEKVTIRRAIRNGELEAQRFGNTYRCTEEQYQKWLEKLRVEVK